MTAPKPRAVVRIRVTVEMALDDSWGDECTVAQVQKQGLDGVEMALRRGLVIDGLSAEGTKMQARIVGTPKLTMTVVDYGGESS